MAINVSVPRVARGAGAHISAALKQFMVEQEARRRQEMLDELTFDREARLKDQHAQQMELGRSQLESIDEQRRSQAEQRNTEIAKTVAGTLVPGVIDATAAEALRRGHMGALVQQDTPTLPSQSLAVPAAGLDAAPEEQAAAPVIASQEHEAQPGEQRFIGNAQQQQDAQQMAVFQRLVDDPNTPEDVRLAAQFALGGKTVPTELVRPERTQTVFRTSADRRTVERMDESGQWVPHAGPVPQDAHWLQEPQPSGSVSVNLGADAVDLAAWQYLQSGTMPPLGMGAGNMRAMILERAAQLAQEGNINPQANAALYRADSASLTQITRSLNAITAFENTAQRNIGIMQDAMQKITDTGIPILNRRVRELQNMTGNPDIAAFNAGVRVVIPEIARILTQPNLTGQLTDSARHEMEAVVRGDATVEQMNAVVNLLVQDMVGRKTDLEAQKKAIEDAIRARGPQRGAAPGIVAPDSSAAPGAAPGANGASGTPGRIRYDINGNPI